MADGEEVPSDNFRSNAKKASKNESTECEGAQQLGLGINFKAREKTRVDMNNCGASGSGMNDIPKKDDNPFSFKHFLKGEGKNYQNQGARPKVYCEGRPVSSISDLDLRTSTETKQTRVVPEFSSALPDFVQDHLVIEQCYLGKDQHNNYSANVNNLPDFTPSRGSVNVNRLNVDSSSDSLNHRNSNSSSNVSIPLDLPSRPQGGFPLDLPGADSRPTTSRSCPPSAEVGVSKSLPDFLADGAVRTQSNSNGTSASQSPEWEMDRLRQELEICRRHLTEQQRRSEGLQRELDLAKNREHEYTQNLATTLQQVEDNLRRSNRRATTAENAVLKLKQEVKSLTNQVAQLQLENSTLRGSEGAVGGASFVAPNELHSQRLAQELRAAASTAEHSLRQLLTGVDNLRIMAATLENMHRIEERTESFLDLDDEAGPAL